MGARRYELDSSRVSAANERDVELCTILVLNLVIQLLYFMLFLIRRDRKAWHLQPTSQTFFFSTVQNNRLSNIDSHIILTLLGPVG